MRRAALAAIVALSASTGAAAAAAEPIRIGSFLAVTGPAAFLGEPEKRTLELYARRLNEAGGVLGRPVELTVYDTGGNAKDAVTYVRRLLDQDRVDFLIGGTTTGDTMAVLQLVEQAGKPFISLAGASTIVEPVRPWVFKTPHSDRMAVEKVYADMRQRGIDEVGVIAGGGGFDKSCVAEAKAMAPKHGVTIKAEEQYGQADTDTTPQLARIKAAGVEGVLFCGFGAPSSLVTRNHAQLGIEAPLYHSHGSCSKQFIAGAGAAAEGVRLPCAALVVADQLPADDPQRAVALAYVEAYKAAYGGEDVSTFGGHAYDALHLLVDAIGRAGSTEPAKVRDALEATKGFVGVDGIFNMGPQDHMGLGPESFKMVEVRDGGWKYLY
jgi:branched-chain amino acid transport system substrate-binding protein